VNLRQPYGAIELAQLAKLRNSLIRQARHALSRLVQRLPLNSQFRRQGHVGRESRPFPHCVQKFCKGVHVMNPIDTT
jgi:hypothetical protein